MPAPAVITVKGLRKAYGELRAVDGVDLRVERGEVFAFLGPNGAGKTTTVEILEGYRKRDGGEVEVLGEDPERPTRAWRERIGIVLQRCRMEPEHTVRETLALFSGYYRAPRPIDDVVELVGLGGQRDQRVGKLSGGQQRRLDVALALIGDPDLVFLDEPTTGFDPAARREAWAMLGSLRDQGMTILLTTHYMEEAQVLADRAAIIVGGKIMAEGTPAELVAQQGHATEVSFKVSDDADIDMLAAVFDVDRDDGRVSFKTAAPDEAIELLNTWSKRTGNRLEDLEVRRATLEDVFLDLTKEA